MPARPLQKQFVFATRDKDGRALTAIGAVTFVHPKKQRHCWRCKPLGVASGRAAAIPSLALLKSPVGNKQRLLPPQDLVCNEGVTK